MLCINIIYMDDYTAASLTNLACKMIHKFMRRKVSKAGAARLAVKETSREL